VLADPLAFSSKEFKARYPRARGISRFLPRFRRVGAVGYFSAIDCVRYVEPRPGGMSDPISGWVNLTSC